MAETGGSSWQLIATTAQLDDREAMEILVDDLAIAIFKVGESFYATSGICTHAHAKLCEGYVEGDIIECPLHAGRFHIPTGKAVGAPVTENLKVYPLRVESGDIYIRVG